MFEPSWWFAFFTFLAGGAIGFWVCAAMAVAAVSDAQAEDARRRTVEEMARESQR